MFRYIKLIAILKAPITVRWLPRSTMNSPDRVLTREKLDQFSYLDLVEMHDDLEKWLIVWQSRLNEIQEEIKHRIEEKLGTH